MALVEYDGIETVQTQLGRDTQSTRSRVLLEQKIAQNLCRHDDHIRIGAELQVACHDAHRWKHVLEVIEFLIAQGLDRSCVEDTASLGQTVGNLIFAHKSLTGAGLCRHQDILVATDGRNRVLLERVERELVFNREGLRHGATGLRGLDDIQVRGIRHCIVG